MRGRQQKNMKVTYEGGVPVVSTVAQWHKT